MKKYEWKPWVDAGNHVPEVLPIAEPPCKHCKLFMPHHYTKIDIIGDGRLYSRFTACIAEEMHRDFSCYVSDEVDE